MNGILSTDLVRNNGFQFAPRNVYYIGCYIRNAESVENLWKTQLRATVVFLFVLLLLLLLLLLLFSVFCPISVKALVITVFSSRRNTVTGIMLNYIKQKCCAFTGCLNRYIYIYINTRSLDRIITGDRILCYIRKFSQELGRILPNKHDKYNVFFWNSVNRSACNCPSVCLPVFMWLLLKFLISVL